MSAAAHNRPVPPDEPLLLGLIIDVSFSMVQPLIAAGGDDPRHRLDGVRDALDELIAKAGSVYRRPVSDWDEPPQPMLLFALGFGFRKARRPQPGAIADGRIRDLLPSTEPWTEVEYLTRTWPEVKERLGTLGLRALGPSSPLAEALEAACERLSAAGAAERPGDATVFVVTDGEPSGHDGVGRAVRAAAQLKSAGVTVMTCLLTPTGVGASRRLYGGWRSRWPEAARLMFECSSELGGEEDPIRGYLNELNWAIEPRARLFAAIDNYDDLSSYLNTTLSLLGVGPSVQELVRAASGQGGNTTVNYFGNSTIYGPVVQSGSVGSLTFEAAGPDGPRPGKD